ncbi:MAG TPA: hypothetical protein VFR78_14500 [Pyrinomonadaceae bacterium]|nr:hypothetical protein [Pyrinomonadaceae bacterium]
MAKKIKINTVTGPSDGAALENYYFEESGEGYNFYAPGGGNPLNTQLITPTNATFHFNVAGYTNPFYLTVSTFPVMAMSGSWTDNPQQLKDVPGSGTFQAQASGTGPIAEEAAAANAK